MNSQESLVKNLVQGMVQGLQEASEKLILPKAVNWIENNFFIPETRNDPILRGRIGLQPYQRDVLNEALTPDEKGNYKYSIIVWSDIKKSGKSCIAAAVNLYRSSFTEFGEFYVIANDLKQADSRVAHYIRRAVELNPKMRAKYHVQGYKITTPTGAFIEAIPIDPSGEAGSNADMISVSELWGAHEEDKQKMWAEMTLSPTKYGKSFRWIESYAGFMEESDLLYSLYELGVKQGEPLWPDRLYNVTDGSPTPLEVYVNKSAGMLCLWNTQPRCPWQTREYYCLPLPKNKDELLVLTKKGWKAAVDITYSDQLCTRNKRGFIQYQKPTNIFRSLYSGKLLRLKHSKCDLSMTPEHRILGSFASHTRKVKKILSVPLRYEYKEAKEAIKNQIGWIPGHGNWKHKALDFFEIENEKYDATLFVKLLAWYLSEGYTTPDTRNKKTYFSVSTISQDQDKNPEKYAIIEKLCRDLNINITARKNGIAIYNSRLARYFQKFGKSYEKRIPRIVLEKCSQEQLRGFLDAYIMGDGTKKRNGNGEIREDSFAIYTNSDGMMLDLMEVAFKVGYRPRHTGSYSSAPEKGRKPIHHIVIMKSHLGWSGGNGRKHWTDAVAENGTEVWCPTTKNGNFYVMQKGVCWWSGNSSEEKILTPGQFARIHRNQWVSNTETFIPMPWFWACKRRLEEWPVTDPKHQAMVIALDAATSNDNFALWAGTRHPHRPDEILTVVAKKWTPAPGTGKIDFQGTEANPGPEILLRRLIKENNVVQVCFDPYQLFDFCNRLKKEGLAWFKPFNQGVDRLLADSQLRDLIRERRFWHRGEPDLEEHLQNANAKLDDQDSKVRIVKRVDRLKIDLAVAASMGSYTLLYLNL